MNIRLFAEEIREPEGLTPASSPDAAESAAPPAWEMIEAGRYMPRRIRGSYLGRELG